MPYEIDTNKVKAWMHEHRGLLWAVGLSLALLAFYAVT